MTMREAEEKELEYLTESTYDSHLFRLTFYFIQTKIIYTQKLYIFKFSSKIIAVPPWG